MTAGELLSYTIEKENNIKKIGFKLVTMGIGMGWKGDGRMKCIKPMKHRPEFEGKSNCKHCEREARRNKNE